ncbi:MAG TPA: hypothetical protein DCO79_16995 [Spirochaeta sp.]|nr:hypothetical protein [Spirochaeta sp.]
MKKRSKIGKRIKRTFILLLVIAAAGAVFFFGYYQFQLPADNYGVIFTKYTGDGWNHEVIKPGTARIEWQGLIPLNLSIERFILLPVTSRITVDGNLPSAEVYSMYLEGSPDFHYSYTFDIAYTLKSDSLVELVSEDFLRESNFDSWLSDIESALSTDAVNFIRTKADDHDYMNRISYNYRLMEADLMAELTEVYSHLDFISFTPLKISFPDLALYIEGRRQYFEVEKFHSDIQQAALEKTTTRLVEESAKLELLEKYGELFSKYPRLIDYYAIFQSDGEGMIPSIELPASADTAEIPEIQQLMRGTN